MGSTATAARFFDLLEVTFFCPLSRGAGSSSRRDAVVRTLLKSLIIKNKKDNFGGQKKSCPSFYKLLFL